MRWECLPEAGPAGRGLNSSSRDPCRCAHVTSFAGIITSSRRRSTAVIENFITWCASCHLEEAGRRLRSRPFRRASAERCWGGWRRVTGSIWGGSPSPGMEGRGASCRAPNSWRHRGSTSATQSAAAECVYAKRGGLRRLRFQRRRHFQRRSASRRGVVRRRRSACGSTCTKYMNTSWLIWKPLSFRRQMSKRKRTRRTGHQTADNGHLESWRRDGSRGQK